MKKSTWLVALLGLALTVASAMAQNGTWSKTVSKSVGNSQGGGFADVYAYANINTASVYLPCQSYVRGRANVYLWDWYKNIANIRGHGEVRNDKGRLWGYMSVMGSTIWNPDYSVDLYYSEHFSWYPSYTFFSHSYYFTVCCIPCSIEGSIGGNPRIRSMGYFSPTRLDLNVNAGAYAWGSIAGGVGIPYLAQFKLGTTLKVCDSGCRGTASLRWTGRCGSLDATFNGLSANFWYEYTYAIFFSDHVNFAKYTTGTELKNLLTL